MTEQAEVIEAEVVEPGQELATVTPVEQPPATLFRTDDPVEVVEKASTVAQALKDVLERQGMVQQIQGRPHVRVEGWQTLGSMLGVVPVVAWTREVENGWEARVEARTLDGRVVGAAEAMCSRDENTWKKRDPYALRSMAQTRATSKALRGPLGFVVTLAGYEATPAEEMPADQPHGPEHGPAVQNAGPASNALVYLLGDEEAAKGVWATVVESCGGYMPQAVADAIVTVARAVRAAGEGS